MREIFIPYNISILLNKDVILEQAARIIETGGTAYFLTLQFTDYDLLIETIDKFSSKPDILPALENYLHEIVRRINYPN